ncbi:hypothetical protein IWZ01DRAFT_544366 [Phyllosticta capitalensis]
MPKVSTIGGGGRPPRKPYYKPPDKGHYNELPSLPNWKDWKQLCLRCGHGVHGEGHLTCQRKCHHCRTFNHIGFKCPEKGDNFYKRYAGRSAGEREEPAKAMAPPPKPHPDKRNTSERRPFTRGNSTHSAERNTSERRPSPRGYSTHSRRHESRQDDSRSRRRDNRHDRSRSRSRSLSPSHRSLLEILVRTVIDHTRRDRRSRSPSRHSRGYHTRSRSPPRRSRGHYSRFRSPPRRGRDRSSPPRHQEGYRNPPRSSWGQPTAREDSLRLQNQRRSSEQRLDLPANHEEPQVKDEPSNSEEPQVKDESSESEEPQVKYERSDSEDPEVKVEPRESEELPVKAEPSGADADEKI